jgi:hypothetical protein
MIFCVGIEKEETAYCSDTVYSYTSTTFDINSQADFEIFVNTFSSSTNTFYGKTVNLNCDVDMSDYSCGIFKKFYGNFYGNGNTINNASYLVFGTETYSTTIITNLNINNFKSTKNKVAIVSSNKGTLENIHLTGSIKYTVIGGLVYENYGTISNCYNYADLDVSSQIDSLGVSGIAFNNYGTISDSCFMGNITANNTVKALGSLVAYNQTYTLSEITYYGTIENSFATAEINITTTSDSANDSTLPTNCATLVGNNNGQLTNCYFIGYFSGYLDLDISVIGDDSANTNSTPYTNVYMMTDTTQLCYDSSSSDFITPVGNINAYIDYSSPNDDVYVANANSYPLLPIYDGLGTSSSPFLINDVFGIYNLRYLYNTNNEIYYIEFSDDVDCNNFDIAIELNNFTFDSTIDGKGFVIENYDGTSLFSIGDASIISNLGFYNCPSVVISDTLFEETSIYTFGYDATSNFVTSTIPSLGTGTALDPYIITTRDELSYIDGSSAYFQLDNSIIVNSQSEANDFYLDIATFSGNLDGNGFSIVGLFEPIVATNTGTITNLTIRGYITDNENGCLLAQYNSGSITDIDINSSIGSDVDNYGIVQENNGYIGQVISNGNDATALSNIAGIAITNNSTIENCFVFMTTTEMFALDNTNGTVSTSIGYNGLSYKGMDNNTLLSIVYFTLLENNFDFTNIYGYEIGTSNSYPTLMEDNLTYKTDPELYNETKVFNYTYSSTTSYTKSQIINTIVDTSSGLDITWEYNGEDYSSETTLQDAGIYTVEFVFDGDTDYLPSKYTATITISKQTVTTALTFGTGEFDNIVTDYNGYAASISQPSPTNLTSYGYEYSYILYQGVDVITEIIESGTYSQTITGVSNNYSNVTKTRTITISKVGIEIEVGSKSINYLEDVDVSTAGITFTSGIVLADDGKTVEELLTPSTSQTYSTDYSNGNNAGTYYISYTASFTNYSISTVTNGVLTVNTIDLEQGDIVFDDKTVDYNGYDQIISASGVDDDISVTYDQNTYHDVGSYEVKATFSKENYNDLSLSAEFIIKKVDLSITCDDLILDYLSARTSIDASAFACVNSGLVGEDIDSSETLLDTLSFAYKITKDGEEISSYDVGSYSIELEITGDLNNYNILSYNGILTIEAGDMYSLYASHTNYSTTYNGSVKTYPITYFDSYGVTVVYTITKDSVTVESAINVGTYQIEATVPKISDNYLDTTYNYTITINRADLSIYFDNSAYSAEYNTQNIALEESYPYEGSLPDGLTAQFIVKKDGTIVTEAIEADEYYIFYYVPQSTNYKEKTISAVLTINSKAVTITMQNTYTYTSNNILPVITGITGDYNDELDSSLFTYNYYDSEDEQQDRISIVGSYVLVIVLNNSNYYVESNSFAVVITPIELDIELNYIEYYYGFTGDMTYNDIDYKIYSGGIIIRQDYYIDETSVYLDIKYYIDRDDAGTYTVSSIEGTQNYTFGISDVSYIDNNNKVKIIPVTLTKIWKFGSSDISGLSKTIDYAGVDQLQYISYTIVGLVNDQVQSDFEFEITEINSKTLYDVGSYVLYLSLLNETNYVMDSTFLTITISKISLNLTINDVTVLKGESFTSRSYQMANTVGLDKSITNIYELKGASLSLVCSYTTSATVGSTFQYYYTGSFTNYTLSIIRYGTLTVIENPKITFTMYDAVYAYDGTYKSLQVTQSDVIISSADVVLTYSSNNYQKDVGTYDITLTVHYNYDDSEKYISRTLTILQSYPTLVIDDMQMAYYDNRVLLAEDIEGKAYLGSNEIDGTFSFAENYELEKGSKASGYNIIFTPTDIENLLETTEVIYIEGIVIDSSIFTYSDLSLITYTNSGFQITGTVTMYMTKVMDNLTLYKDGILVDNIVFTNTESTTIEIKSGDEVVYSVNYDIEYIDTTNSTSIIVNSSYLDLIYGLTITDDEIIVSSEGGRIALVEEYAENYDLYINGAKITTDYPINGTEGSIVVVIKKAGTSIVVFAEEYTVEISTEIVEEEKSYTIWVVVGSLFGGTAVIVGLYFLISKAVKNRSMGFNPYSKK